MLQELSIRNLAIIDDLHVVFSDGLTILSGETGAGKSIIINAVNLLLGGRATSKHIRTGEDSAEIEALFMIGPKSGAAEIMEAAGYEASDSLLIRRIISGNDRHRLYINGRIATVKLLNAIAANLASISGQHANQGLLNQDEHLLILDRFGELTELREQVAHRFNEISPLIRKLKDLESKRGKQAERIETLEFLKLEIEEAGISVGEDEELEAELLKLKNAETLYQAVHGSVDALYGAGDAIAGRLAGVAKDLEKVSAIDPALEDAAGGVSDAAFRVEDIASELRSYLSNIVIDENRIEEVETRLDLLRKMKRKYGGSLEAVVERLESMEKELSEIWHINERIAEAEAELSEKHGELAELALELSEKRKQTAKVLSEKVEAELSFLQMDKTRFGVSFQSTPATGQTSPFLSVGENTVGEAGLDKAAFMIAPNVGEAMKPLSSIASGGELSRVVLALKVILAETESVETVIFDEVDAGIGGGVAEVVGQKLRNLSDYYQVICITHLPQIAKFGLNHLKIMKGVSDGRTRTVIEPLDEQERVKELARMLGGVEMTRATLDHAEEMLQSAGN